MKLLVKITKSWWFPWLLLGIIVRFLLAPITIHSDTWSLNFDGYLFSVKGIFNIYDYLANIPPSHEWYYLYDTRHLFTYPPLAYFTIGGFMFLAKPFLNSAFYTEFINQPLTFSLTNPEIFRQLIIFKSLFLFFDLAIAFLLMDLFNDPKKKKIAFFLWLFNPLVLYASYMVGNFEVIPVFFSVLALNLVLKDKKEWAAVSLGVGAAFKMFPLFFLPFLVLLTGKNLREKAKLFLLGVVPYILTILPFLPSRPFRSVSLFSTQSQKMLHMSLPVSGAEVIYLFVFIFFLLAVLAGYRKQQPQTLWWYFLAVMLLYFGVTHYHPQWFLWLIPFLIIEMVKNNFKYLWLSVIILLSWLGITFLFEPSLNFALFAPLSPDLLKMTPFSEAVSKFYNVDNLRSLIRSVAAAASFSLVFLTLIKNELAEE